MPSCRSLLPSGYLKFPKVFHCKVNAIRRLGEIGHKPLRQESEEHNARVSRRRLENMRSREAFQILRFVSGGFCQSRRVASQRNTAPAAKKITSTSITPLVSETTRTNLLQRIQYHQLSENVPKRRAHHCALRHLCPANTSRSQRIAA